MSHHTNLVRLMAVANSLGEWKDKVIFVGGATVSLYATRPLAISVRPTDDVDVVVELVSIGDFYKLQEQLLALGYMNDKETPMISRFLYEGLKVDFIPTDPSILGFSNNWYPNGVKTSIDFEMINGTSIRIFTAPYFIASKMEAFKTRGKGDFYSSHDLEDIIFILDNRDSIFDELINTDPEVKEYLKKEFTALLSAKSFEEALIGIVEQSSQTERKNRIIKILKDFVS